MSITTATSAKEIPWQHVLGFVQDDPLTLLACMMVSKATRKSAGRLLNLQDDRKHGCLSTLAHRERFSKYLANPSCYDWPGAFGPTRPWAIKACRKRLKKSVIILKYEASHTDESCIVAIVDHSTGHLCAIYESDVKNYYQRLCGCSDGFFAGHGCDDNIIDFTIRCSGTFNLFPDELDWTPAQNAWIFQERSYSNGCAAYGERSGSLYHQVEVEAANYELFRQHQDELSCAEIWAVLGHAFSLNAIAVHEFKSSIHNSTNQGNKFDYLHDDLEGTEEGIEEFIEWSKSLAHEEYPLERTKRPCLSFK